MWKKNHILTRLYTSERNCKHQLLLSVFKRRFYYYYYSGVVTLTDQETIATKEFVTHNSQEEGHAMPSRTGHRRLHQHSQEAEGARRKHGQEPALYFPEKSPGKAAEQAQHWPEIFQWALECRAVSRCLVPGPEMMHSGLIKGVLSSMGSRLASVCMKGESLAISYL